MTLAQAGQGYVIREVLRGCGHFERIASHLSFAPRRI